MGTTVRLVGRDGFAELVPAWEELAGAALEPNPFYEHWMLLPALEAFAPQPEVRLLCVWHEGKLGALLPVLPLARYKGLPVRVLTSWRHTHCLLCTPLVRAGRAASASIGALLDWLLADGERAAALELRYLVAGGPFHAALAEELNERGLAAVTTDVHARPVLRRAADAETYMKTAMSRDTRRANDKYERALQAQGKVAYRVLRAGDDAARWVEEFLALEASGWKGAAGSALACSAPNRRFATQTMLEAHRRGRLFFTGIDVDERPIARLASFIAGDGVIAFKTAYDEGYRQFAPGIVSEIHYIREFHRLPGVQWVDSYTDGGGSVLDRLWKDRLAIQSLAIGSRRLGALAISALPFLSWAKRRLQREAAVNRIAACSSSAMASGATSSERKPPR